MSFDSQILIDLSVQLGPSPSEVLPVEIERVDHRQGGAHLAELVAVEQERLPAGLAWASERISAFTHSGTHMDAPFHYAPRCGEQPSRTIDEMPLEWFWAPGVMIDVAGGPADQLVGLAELAAFEAASGGAVAAPEIVLIRTGAEAWHGDATYGTRGRGLAPDLVRLLIDRGVRVIGTDAWSIDPPLPAMRERAGRLGAGSVWAAHYVGREAEFCTLERLCNLVRLPARGFRLACFPIKVQGGSAGWVRSVAFLPDRPRQPRA